MPANGLRARGDLAPARGRTRAAVRPLPLAALAAACAGALVLLYLALLRTTAGQRLDEHAVDRRALATRPVRYAIHDLLTTVNAGMLVIVLALLVGQAILRRRPPLALAAAATIGGAALCTELLKALLSRPDLYPGAPYGNTFPSGHTTIALSVGIAAALLAPPHRRALVAAGAAAYGAAVGIAVVAAGWHRPSDVVGAYLVVTGWAALVALAMELRWPGMLAGERGEARRATRVASRQLLAGGLVLSAGYAAVLAVVLAREAGRIPWTLPGKPFLAACAAMAVAVAALTSALLAALGRSLAP